jgi:hypothetical protein
MSDQLPDPQFRVYFNPGPRLRGLGCLGCLLVIFVLGGLLGILVYGWRVLLGV